MKEASLGFLFLPLPYRYPYTHNMRQCYIYIYFFFSPHCQARQRISFTSGEIFHVNSERGDCRVPPIIHHHLLPIAIPVASILIAFISERSILGLGQEQLEEYHFDPANQDSAKASHGYPRVEISQAQSNLSSI